MRKVTFGGANSLDNFFARKDDTIDWLLWCKEVPCCSAPEFRSSMRCHVRLILS
jgi:hypothetical protein